MLKQIIPSEYCLSCDVCCRFIDKNAALAPCFLPHEISDNIKPRLNKSCRVKLNSFKDMYACPFFSETGNKCSIYSKRPFDCQIYPFAIMFDKSHDKIILGIDKKCPFTVEAENLELIKNYFRYLVDILEKKETALLIAGNPLFIGGFQEDVTPFSTLDTLTKLIANNPEKKGFTEISLKDKALFDKFFKNTENPDSGRNFINLYIWKDANPVWWALSDRRSENGSLEILLETDSGFVNFNSIKRFPDYIYLREDLAELKGNKYKHKRASCNHFAKNYKFQYLPYKKSMKNECLELFSKWASARKKKSFDLYYHKLLEDSLPAHKLAIENFESLGLTGRVIKIKNKIRAYTFGFELREDMFCVLLEVCDLKFKGISEFIFREFCGEMAQYKYINTMDDSGLENLTVTKLSYHPIQGRF